VRGRGFGKAANTTTVVVVVTTGHNDDSTTVGGKRYGVEESGRVLRPENRTGLWTPKLSTDVSPKTGDRRNGEIDLASRL
jgi:hypothetical protein